MTRKRTASRPGMCSEVTRAGWSYPYCSFRATVTRGGKGYCGRHDPELRRERARRQTARITLEIAITSARNSLQSAEHQLASAALASGAELDHALRAQVMVVRHLRRKLETLQQEYRLAHPRRVRKAE